MTVLREAEPEKRRALSPAVLLAGFAALLYLPLLISPLRLTFDAVVLLSIADSAAQGHGFFDHGMPTVYPPGYPAMVAALLRMGIAHPPSLVLLNFFGAIAGLAAVYDIGRRAFLLTRAQILAVIALFLFSFTVFKQASQALTDLPFFGIAMPCLAAIVRASQSTDRRLFIRWLAGATVLAIVSLVVRRTGVALFPPLVWPLVVDEQIRREIRSHRLAVGCAGAALAVSAFFIIERNFTLHDFTVVAGGRPVADVALQIASFRFTELGELISGLPAGKLHFLPGIVFELAGLLTMGLIVAGLVIRRKPSPVEIFMVSWLAVLSVWPFYDPRFWIPAMPVATIYAWIALRRLLSPAAGRAVLTTYLILFCAIGTAALGSSALLSFAGDDFGARYANGNDRDTYCAFFGRCPGGFDPSRVDPKDLHVLRVYR